MTVEYVNPKLDIFDIAILTTFSYVFLRALSPWRGRAGFAVTKNVIFFPFLSDLKYCHCIG